MPEKDILIINDSLTLNALLKLTLEAEGFSIVFAETGCKGIVEAQKSHFKLILLDYILPDIIGVEVCKKLRENEYKTYTPIVFITGVDEDEISEEIKEAGADAYFHPPFMGKTFIDKIKNIIKTHN